MTFKKRVVCAYAAAFVLLWTPVSTTIQETDVNNVHYTLINIHPNKYLVNLYCEDVYTVALTAVQNLVDLDDSHFQLAEKNKQECVRQCMAFPLLCERGVEEVKYKYKYRQKRR